MTRTIDFFIAGVQKGATTALWSFLRQHPGIQLSLKKELHFFDAETFDWENPPYKLLHANFEWGPANVVRGESTPIYTYWMPSLQRIRIYNPEAKLIVSFRHPTFRAFSHWRMTAKRKEDELSFEEATSAVGRRRVEQAPNSQHRYFSYVERGFYAVQVERLLDSFPRKNVLFLRTDDLWSRPGRVLTDVERFLGVDERLGNSIERQYVVPVDSRELGGIPSDVRLRLDDLYRSDIRRTTELTGLNLADWLDPDYIEPTNSAPQPVSGVTDA